MGDKAQSAVERLDTGRGSALDCLNSWKVAVRLGALVNLEV